MTARYADRLCKCQSSWTDIFCLYYDAKSKAVRGINGSGRSPAALTLEYLRSRGINGQSVRLPNM